MIWQTKDYIEMNRAFRAKINASSSHQPCHAIHGKRGIYIPNEETFFLIDEDANFWMPHDIAMLVLWPTGESC